MRLGLLLLGLAAMSRAWPAAMAPSATTFAIVNANVVDGAGAPARAPRAWADLVRRQNAAVRPRARDLGVPFEGTAGSRNAITDVTGVEVGFATIVTGEGALVRGKGPVRTGVTAVLPRGRSGDNVFAGWHTLNGNGEMTGTTWITEGGFLEGPILITNTHSVGVARDTAVEWMARYSDIVPLPIAAETYDGTLNDILGFHVKREHVLAALDGATPGAVPEGNVGGGTGMIAFGFKGGTGTASRVVTAGGADYVVGALVQANFGRRPQFLVAGAPVGREIPDLMPETGRPRAVQGDNPESGSIIVVIATNAPLLPHQLRRLAQRAGLGVARVGGTGGNGSGDIFVAFSTANPDAYAKPATAAVTMLANDAIDPLFQGAIQATEEAIINAVVAAETMVGRDGNRVHALPHDRLRSALRKYNRLAP
ncbi:MAG: P1 family peptidase [Acidobacteriota bacterium]|nr:P1 family peptidase [Acidobacteriota bacterium]